MDQQPTLAGIAQRAARRSEITMAEFLDQCKARGEVAVPAGDAIFAYGERAGIPSDYLELAWLEFRERHLENPAKKYRDWRAAFRNSVRDRWFRLWYFDNGECLLTVQGQQAARVHGKAVQTPISGQPNKQEALEARNREVARRWASQTDRDTANARENAKAKQMLFGSAPHRPSRHSGFDQIDYREGINDDGSF